MTLGGVGIPAWSKLSEGLYFNKFLRFGINRMKKFYGNRFFLNKWLVNTRIIDDLDKLLDIEINTRFKNYKKIPKIIDMYFQKRMKPFIENLP